MPLPDTYSELYPGRFLKSDLLKGKKVTLKIEDVDLQDLVGETGKPAAKVIVRFAKPQAEALQKLPLELVLPKTNGECFRRMFGNNPHTWVGKRVTLFPSTTSFGREKVDCIRIWGSPDLTEDMPISIPQGRKKPLEMVMHAVKAATAEPARTNVDPRILTAFEVLGYNDQERAAELAKGLPPAQLLAQLNAEADKRAAAEV